MSGCGKERNVEPPPTVKVAAVVQKEAPIFAEWAGTSDGMVNAAVRTETKGILIKGFTGKVIL